MTHPGSVVRRAGLAGALCCGVVLANDGTDDVMRPLLADSVLLGTGVPGSRGFTGSGRRVLVVPEVGTYQVLAGGSVRFTPDPGFVGEAEPVRYSVQGTRGSRVGAYLRVRVVSSVLDPQTEPAIADAIDGVPSGVDGAIGDNGLATAPRPASRSLSGDLPAVLPRTGAGDLVWTAVLMLSLGASLRRVPARRPVHR